MNHLVTIDIARPKDDVFAYMEDIDREHEWQPDLKSATKDPAGATRVGTRKTYVSSFMGKDVRNTYVATVWEPGERVVYETTKDSAVRLTTEMRWETVDGATRVTMKIDGTPTGFMKFLPKAVLEAASRSALETSLDRLKARLEGKG